MIPRRCPRCSIGKFSSVTDACMNCGMSAELAEGWHASRFTNADFGPMTQAELDAINRHAKPVHIDPGLLDEINDMIGKAAGLTPEMMARTSTTSRTADEAMARLNERVHAERKKKDAERLQREQAEAARRKAEELRKAADSFRNVHEEAERIKRRREEEESIRGFDWAGFERTFFSGQQYHKQAQPQQPQRSTGIDLDLPMLRLLIQLCHPDKHKGSENSQKATQFLLGLKAKMEGGR